MINNNINFNHTKTLHKPIVNNNLVLISIHRNNNNIQAQAMYV